jgi:GDP-4-dehydro-6-deoxy-D-mannose reductase
LLTGASGFVGRHLLAELRRRFPAARLIAAVTPAALPEHAADSTVAFDLLDHGGMESLIAGLQPDGVVHLAAQASVAASFDDPMASWRVNVLGTLALANAVLRHAPRCRFVFASSAEIYGLSFRSGEKLDELAALQPANPYAASKAACDIGIGEMVLRGLNAIRLRAFNHTGPGQSEAFVVAAFARQIARMEAGQQPPILRVGALDRARDFLDVRDVCAAYATALTGQVQAGEVLNLASGVARPIGDVLDGLLARSELRPRVEEEASRLRPTDLQTVVGDAARASAILGWAPRVPWGETLDSVMADWRDRVRR